MTDSVSEAPTDAGGSAGAVGEVGHLIRQADELVAWLDANRSEIVNARSLSATLRARAARAHDGEVG